MSLNEARIKQQVKKAIQIKPTHISLKRLTKVSNGMRGSKDQESLVAEVDVFIDDSKHLKLFDTIKDPGILRTMRGITMLIVTEGFELKQDDYFSAAGITYKVTYPGKLVEDVYNADLEVIS